MSDTRCIKCLQCVSGCPEKSLEVRSGVGGVFSRVKPVTFALLSVVVFTSIVGTAQISGLWDAKNPSIKAVSQITNPSEIKGWMKWSDVITAFKVNEKQLIMKLGLPENMDRNKTVKEIRQDFGISEEKIRQDIERLSKN